MIRVALILLLWCGTAFGHPAPKMEISHLPPGAVLLCRDRNKPEMCVILGRQTMKMCDEIVEVYIVQEISPLWPSGKEWILPDSQVYRYDVVFCP